MQGFSHTVCSLGLVLGLAGTARAAAPAGSDSAEIDPNSQVPEVIRIDIDVADLPDSRAKIADTFHAELQRLLSEQEQLPAGVVRSDDRRLLVELRPGPIPGADDVLIRVESQLDGATLGETLTENCMSCSDEQVAQKALPMLRPLLDDFPAPAKQAAPSPAAGERSSSADALPVADRREPGLALAGGSLLGVGIVGLGVGIGLIVSDERIVSEPGAARIELIQYRPAGIALAVVGGVATAAGAALLGLALRERARGKLAAGPVLTPHSYGVALSARF